MKSWICSCGRKNDADVMICIYCTAPTTVKEKPAYQLKRVPVKKVSERQASIKSQLHESYSLKATLTANQMHCSGCHSTYWDDHDHTISQKRCKELGKPELIANVENLEYSCRQCHMEWESYKSGEFIKHKNFEKRMAFVKLHDPEMWERRIAVWEANTKPSETI